MKKMITTKDLGAINELLTFENWMALKLIYHSDLLTNKELKKEFKEMAKSHISHHKNLLKYLKANAE
jgi:hypothetical protein